MVRDTTSIIYKQPQNEPCKVQSVCRSSRLFIWGEMDCNKRWDVYITSFTLLINFTSTGSNFEKTVKILVVLKKVHQIQGGTILLLVQRGWWGRKQSQQPPTEVALTPRPTALHHPERDKLQWATNWVNPDGGCWNETHMTHPEFTHLHSFSFNQQTFA